MNDNQTIADLANICRDAAGGEGHIWCVNDLGPDAAFNLAKSGRCFFFLPLEVLGKHNGGFDIFVLNDKNNLSACLSQNGPQRDFMDAIKRLDEATRQLKQLISNQGVTLSVNEFGKRDPLNEFK